jgi:hypothetical protein
MKEIVDEIIAVLSSKQAAFVENTAMMIDTLAANVDGKGQYWWEKRFPIAIVHTQHRIQEDNIQKEFREHGLIDSAGMTPSSLTRAQCDDIANISPQYIQQVDFMVFSAQKNIKSIDFVAKRPHDFWKKLASSDDMAAMVEMEYFATMDSAQIEYELREVIRKRKENSALKDVGFIWIAAVRGNEEAQGVFEHYFHQNKCQIKSSDEGNVSYWIGWSNTLRDVSMRTFYTA